MTKTPRTFTLAWVAKNGRRTWRVVDARFGGPEDEHVKVIEKASVDAERERMLELLERAEKALRICAPGEIWKEVKQALCEHGRLGENGGFCDEH